MLTIILTRITLSYLSCMGQKLEELSLQSLRSFITGREVDGRVITPNLLFFLMVLIHPNLQRKFFSYRGRGSSGGGPDANQDFNSAKGKNIVSESLSKIFFLHKS